jgi:3-methyl-2-oxobutanoate hydroxymethyltransferase
MSETTAPYGGGTPATPVKRVRTHHLREMKERGERWAMLTAYDMYTASSKTAAVYMMAPQVQLLTRSGIPVMAHIGFTPQSEHNLGGYRVQGRGVTGQRLLADAQALEAAGAFACVLEMVPGDVAAQITKTLAIPTIGIGAGPDCDAQVLVWQDMAGLRTGRLPRFVKQYADLHGVLLGAAREYAADVAAGTFPRPEHTF